MHPGAPQVDAARVEERPGGGARVQAPSRPTPYRVDMDFKKLTAKAKQAIDERGGTERLKADAQRLKDIATAPGTLDEKRKQATEVLKAPPSKADSSAKADPDAPPES